jgi:ribosomal protein S27E
MTVREASCPGCGATLVFRNAATVYVVCPHCGGASARTDVDLESLGKVAQVIPVPSVLSLGAEGRIGRRRWSAVGLLQLDHGRGPWNEWCLAFDDGTWEWLAEAQGELLLTRAIPGEGVRPPAALALGAEETLGGVPFQVVERGTARVVAAKGEIPVRTTPGSRYEYADLRAPDGRFATVSEGDGGTPLVFVGRGVGEADLAIVPGTVVPTEAPRISAERLSCPKCGDTVDVRDPASVRVACPACGAMLDPSHGRLRALGVAAALKARPAIPIGSVGVLRGARLEVLAFLVRSVRAGGLWRWREYLLRDSKGGYRWLVENDGHWNLTEPVNPADVVGESRDAVTCRGVFFRFFQRGNARVDHVQGEVYWEVEVGETVRTRDYVSPPLMLSFEGNEKERVVSLARYVPAREVAEAFGVASLPPTEGVAPNEPNPHPHGQHWRAFGALFVAAMALLVFFHAHHAKKRVFSEERVLPLAVASASSRLPTPGVHDGEAFFTPEFRLDPASANVEVALASRVQNGWIGVDGALVELDTGEVRNFQVTLERWSEDGEEDGDPTARIGPVPAGRYALRFAPAAQSSTDIPYTMTVRSQVPATGRAWLAVGLLLIVPVASSVLRARFESRRWENSDAGDSSVFTWFRTEGTEEDGPTPFGEGEDE